ncbi:MAG: aminodeoxychorismate/anthranilate synthase component II [Mycobacteriales bacterium]
MSAAGVWGPRVLVVDNYDSFVFNLVQYLAQLGVDCVVRRNDTIDVDVLDEVSPEAVLIGPGPSTPERAGISVSMVTECARRQLPLLGVCLGHQAIAVAFGGNVDRAPELLHGKTSEVHHRGDPLFVDLPNPFTATRYHSLTAMPESLPDELAVTAWTGSGVIMALRHRELPIAGVQFHPESMLTDGGHLMLARWLREAGLPADIAAARVMSERIARVRVGEIGA